MNPFLSIIIPFFNAEEYIEQTISSICKQITDDIEIILIDDGSTDNTHSIIYTFINKYNNIFYYRILNCGTGGARNYGISRSNGKYIWFIDSDDYISEEALDKLISNLKKTNTDVLHFNFKYVWDDMIKENKKQIIFDGNGNEFLVKGLLRNQISITTWSNIFKRDLIDRHKIRFTPNIFVEDEEFFLKVFAVSDRIISVNDVYYYYVQRNNSVANDVGKIEDRTKSKFIIRKHIKDFMKSNVNINQETVNHIETYLVFLLLFDYCLFPKLNKRNKVNYKKEIINRKLYNEININLFPYPIFKFVYKLLPSFTLYLLELKLKKR
ncbi:glycosyltransferase [Turicibacter sanguinis]|uniref:glycosyltransferase family 2 protein n=1 Tax=Turicibacter sanguinis TaxID=154288 RepID=UPI0012B708AB|nr:glycosyltransferase [Turicibacter sanguinis]MTH11547.1 glycosyltransferase [Turicibacter sanguinis]MTH39366.1 glycosyltransferase [Turicibacter sanguinis]MTH49649.1 glycosyltransferase [Turicibacter sanguinis]MTH80848.1 glycosyltransferase [Turicibacter sanguinis]